MNSGMETVSISTKSALPNSRLSCSAMVPAYGLRWAQKSSGGRDRAAGSGSGTRGGLGRDRGGAAAQDRGLPGRGLRAPLGRSGRDGGRPCSSARSPSARRTRQFPLLPRRLPGAVGDGTLRRRRRRLVPPLAWVCPRLCGRPPRSAPVCRAPPRPAGPPESPAPRWRRPPPPHLGGARARGGRRGRAAARAQRRGGSASWGSVRGPREGGARDRGRRRVGGIQFPDCRLPPMLGKCQQSYKSSLWSFSRG